MGNLTRDPELRHTQNQTAVSDFSIALNRYVKGDEDQSSREETTFVDITAWGKTAENLAKFKKKGELIYVEGRLTVDSWVDQTTGQARSKMKVTADVITFLPSGKNNQDTPPPLTHGQ